MPDVSADLYEMVSKSWRNWIDKDATIKATYNRIRDGTATYREAHRFAELSGDYLAKAFGMIDSSMLPDGKMYYNIAMDVVLPACKSNYELVSDVAVAVQDIANKEANITLGAKAAKMDEANITSIINKITSYENYDDAAWLLKEPIVNFSISTVDRTVEENARVQYSAGINATIERISMGNCCDWCEEVAGTYDYSEVKGRGSDVFRRHNNCRCLVLYKNGKRMENAHSKVSYKDYKDAMQSWQKSVESRKKSTKTVKS